MGRELIVCVERWGCVLSLVTNMCGCRVVARDPLCWSMVTSLALIALLCGGDRALESAKSHFWEILANILHAYTMMQTFRCTVMLKKCNFKSI